MTRLFLYSATDRVLALFCHTFVFPSNGVLKLENLAIYKTDACALRVTHDGAFFAVRCPDSHDFDLNTIFGPIRHISDKTSTEVFGIKPPKAGYAVVFSCHVFVYCKMSQTANLSEILALTAEITAVAPKVLSLAPSKTHTLQ